MFLPFVNFHHKLGEWILITLLRVFDVFISSSGFRWRTEERREVREGLEGHINILRLPMFFNAIFESFILGMWITNCAPSLGHQRKTKYSLQESSVLAKVSKHLLKLFVDNVDLKTRDIGYRIQKGREEKWTSATSSKGIAKGACIIDECISCPSSSRKDCVLICESFNFEAFFHLNYYVSFFCDLHLPDVLLFSASSMLRWWFSMFMCIEFVIMEACGGSSWGTKTERNVLSSSDNAEQFLAFIVQSGFFN